MRQSEAIQLVSWLRREMLALEAQPPGQRANSCRLKSNQETCRYAAIVPRFMDAYGYSEKNRAQQITSYHSWSLLWKVEKIFSNSLKLARPRREVIVPILKNGLHGAIIFTSLVWLLTISKFSSPRHEFFLHFANWLSVDNKDLFHFSGISFMLHIFLIDHLFLTHSNIWEMLHIQ